MPPQKSSPIRVLIVDDQPIVRQEVRNIVGSLDYLTVIGEAGDGEAALELVRELRPDVVLMDVCLPTLSGIETTRLMKSEFPHLTVVGLSILESQFIVEEMVAAGASAYLSKDLASNHLAKAIEAALNTSSDSERPA